MVHSRLFQQFIYWGVWLVIPLLWEVLVGFLSSVLVIIKYFTRRPKPDLDFYPKVSLLIPVYNSQATLKMCLNSIVNQNYPVEKIEVFLIDNGSKDDSYNVFTKFQADNPALRIWWYTSGQGKSKALNKGIFSSSGKYIINIDSDGCLDKNAVVSVVKKFESDDKITCATGVVLIDPDQIRATENEILKVIRLCEMFEYTESFLVGRNFQSAFNTMYTLAGAFSCFRREVLLKTQMYNSETMGEDTHMTFQIKNFVGGKIALVEDAFFYVDPIEDLNKIYTQRQRWQRAELEVASLFVKQHLGGLIDFITKPAVRKLVSDHTLVFPRLIWFFAMIYLYFINYPLSLLIGANLMLYIAYLINSYAYLIASTLYLKAQKDIQSYLLKSWYIPIILPIYRFIVFWVRVAGIVNSLKTDSKWRTSTFTEEVNLVGHGIKKEFSSRFPFWEKVKNFINNR